MSQNLGGGGDRPVGVFDIDNSSGADPKQHLKEITIQTLSQLHFESIQLNSNSVELKFLFSFQFDFH